MSAAHRRMIRRCWSVPKSDRTYPIRPLEVNPLDAFVVDPIAINMLANALLVTMGIPRHMMGRP